MQNKRSLLTVALVAVVGFGTIRHPVAYQRLVDAIPGRLCADIAAQAIGAALAFELVAMFTAISS